MAVKRGLFWGVAITGLAVGGASWGTMAFLFVQDVTHPHRTVSASLLQILFILCVVGSLVACGLLLTVSIPSRQSRSAILRGAAMLAGVLCLVPLLFLLLQARIGFGPVQGPILSPSGIFSARVDRRCVMDCDYRVVIERRGSAIPVNVIMLQDRQDTGAPSVTVGWSQSQETEVLSVWEEGVLFRKIEYPSDE